MHAPSKTAPAAYVMQVRSVVSKTGLIGMRIKKKLFRGSKKNYLGDQKKIIFA